MANQKARIEETLTNPDEVMESSHDPSILLYHRLYERTRVSRKYMLVVVKVLAADAFSVTAFFTDRKKRGTTIWAR